MLLHHVYDYSKQNFNISMYKKKWAPIYCFTLKIVKLSFNIQCDVKLTNVLILLVVPRMRRAESVPSDINNRIDHTAEIPLQFDTLPKAITKRVSTASFSVITCLEFSRRCLYSQGDCLGKD